MSVNLPSSLQRPRPRRQDFRRPLNYQLAYWSEILRAPLHWYGQKMAQGVAPSAPAQWRNGLIIGPSHIGDVLYNTASLPALKAGLPDCHWSYAVSGPSAQVLQGNPFLDEVISIKDNSDGFRTWLPRSRKILAPYRFDAVIAYAIGSSWQDLSLAASLGIPNRVGYVHKGFSGLVTHPVSIRFPQPFPVYFRDLVCQLTGQPRETVPTLRPLVYIQPENEASVDRIATEKGIDWKKQPILTCCVTSRQPTGMWPPEQFLKTIQQVRKQVACTIVYLGAKSDAAQLQRLAQETGSDVFVIAGELDLPSVVAFLRRCRAALTTDSGSRHLANAAGLPVFFVRNLNSRQIETGVYLETEHDFAPPGAELIPPGDEKAVFDRVDSAGMAKEVADALLKPGA